MRSKPPSAYHGYSYPTILDNRVVQWVWKRFFCPHGWHLWDEVGGVESYLFCDACEISFPDGGGYIDA